MSEVRLGGRFVAGSLNGIVRWVVRVLLASAMVLGACQPRPRAVPDAVVPPAALVVADASVPPPDAGLPDEGSVRPGANKEFLREDLDVRSWEQRFERGGRDIFDRRFDLLRATGVRPGMEVADVGAGTGLFTMLFADAVGPKGKVYALDIARPFVEHIEGRARKEGRRNVVARLSSDRSLGLPPASVDVVFVCDVYHHFEYPRAMLASIRRALRPGGRLVVVDFQRQPGKSAAWVLDHVRAGEDVFVAEITAAGFVPLARPELLKENWVRVFGRGP